MKSTLAALVLALLSTSCAGPEIRGPFQRQYVDSETGKPLSGVVFLAVWESVTPTLTGDGGRAFYAAQEAVSDEDGRVELPGLGGPILRPGLNVQFHAFRPGYDYADSPKPEVGTQSRGTDTVAMMRPTSSEAERCAVVHRPSAMPSIPTDDRAPNYMRLLISEM
jgi:hypothetical protein